MKTHIIDHCCNNSRTYIDSFKMINNIELANFDEADIVCYIGCAYTKERIDQSIEEINELIQQKSSTSKLAIFGCITSYKEFYDNFKKIKDIDYIGRGYGQQMQKELTKYLETKLNNQELFYSELGLNFETPERINIVIQDGCTKRCAFCKSNYLNFKLRSTPFEAIISQINNLTDNNSSDYNITEINIAGLNPTEYGLDLYKQPKLAELIRDISKIPTIETILLDSLCLDRIDKDLLHEIITNPKIKRIMIPVQSMDDRLLQLMGRKTPSQETYNILKTISTERPDIFLETIFLICYPTETKECIDKNIKLLEEIKIHNPVISVYKFGKNVKNLKSEHIANVPEEKYYELLDYHRENMIPLIEQQRRDLLSKPVEGKLVYKEADFDYYSTLYRFTTNEFMIKCPTNNSINLGQKILVQPEFLQSEPNWIYATKSEEVKGRVLSKSIKYTNL